MLDQRYFQSNKTDRYLNYIFVFIPRKLQPSSDSSTDLKILFAKTKSYNKEDSNLNYM